MQAEYFVELLIYDELSELGMASASLAYLSFVAYTIFHFWLIFSVDIHIINKLEKVMPWSDYFIRRIMVEFVLIAFCGMAITIPLTIFINYKLITTSFNIPSDGMMISLYYNLLYVTVYNVIFVIAYEAIYLYGQRKSVQLEWEKSQKQQILSQFEALKNQVNPHFLFNSMNALTALIQSDTTKATKFTREFSKVFRYTLEIKDNTVVKLSEELDFLNAYIYLQKIRYGDNLILTMDIDAVQLNEYLPPFSLQLLVENAIKHNVISTEHPLKICIRSDEGYLIVQNNVQPRTEEIKSTKIGLTNLQKRYNLICDIQPTFKINGTSYTAKLPILNEHHLN